MARSSARDGHPSAPSAQLADRTQGASVLPEYTQGQVKASLESTTRVSETQPSASRVKRTQGHELAAILFDEALKAAKLETIDVAELLDVSESLVRRMRSKDARERASFVQMLMLPPQFWYHLNRLTNERYGLRKMLIAQLLNVTADLALAVER